MKLCLINLKYESGRISNFRRQEHLGLGYIGSMCEREGHKVEIVNAQFEDIEIEAIILRVKEFAPDIIGISVYEELINQTVELVEKVKEIKKEVKVILGGHYATFNAEELLTKLSGIDYISVGEGEQSIPNLLDALEKGEDIEKVSGFVFKKEKQIVFTGYPDIIDNLDLLPYPKRKIMDRKNCVTNISASRGCYGQCSFCSTHAFMKCYSKKGIRIRTPRNVVDEIAYLVNSQRAYHFFFTDDNFMMTEILNKGWIDEFVKLIKEQDLKIVFNLDCRVNDIEFDIFKKLKEAGLIGVFLGVESNSENTLKLYNKCTTTEQNVNSVKILNRLRIDYWIGNIMFHPYTHISDIKDDIDYFENINYCRYFHYSNPISCLVGKLKIYKGTDLFYRLEKEGKAIHNGLSCDYEFDDKRVKMLWEFLQRYKKCVEKIVELDPIHQIELANSAQKNELSGEIHRLSRKYMNKDFEIFKKAFEYLNGDNFDTISAQLDRLEAESRKSMQDIYNALRAVCISLS